MRKNIYKVVLHKFSNNGPEEMPGLDIREFYVLATDGSAATARVKKDANIKGFTVESLSCICPVDFA